MHNSNFRTINEEAAEHLFNNGTYLFPITNLDDRFVPVEDATLSEEPLALNLGNDPLAVNDLSRLGGHNQILTTPEVADFLAMLIDAFIKFEPELEAKKAFDQETEDFKQTVPGNWAQTGYVDGGGAYHSGENHGYLSPGGSITYLVRLRLHDGLSGCVKSYSSGYVSDLTVEITILDPEERPISTSHSEAYGELISTHYGIYADDAEGIYKIVLNQISGEGDYILYVGINAMFGCIIP